MEYINIVFYTEIVIDAGEHVVLSFGKFNGMFDTRIKGLGLDLLVSEVQNTELKVPKVGLILT